MTALSTTIDNFTRFECLLPHHGPPQQWTCQNERVFMCLACFNVGPLVYDPNLAREHPWSWMLHMSDCSLRQRMAARRRPRPSPCLMKYGMWWQLPRRDLNELLLELGCPTLPDPPY